MRDMRLLYLIIKMAVLDNLHNRIEKYITVTTNQVKHSKERVLMTYGIKIKIMKTKRRKLLIYDRNYKNLSQIRKL